MILNRKRANATGGSILYTNKEKLHGHLIIHIHLAKRFLQAKLRIKYAYMNNSKGPVNFYERKFKAIQIVQIRNLMSDR